MISAREFCREPGLPHALFLTYAFDPLFFERVPLRDLKRGGSRNIVIAADAGQLREAMAQSLEQLVHLGRSYVLAETVTANIFHPKLIARLSPTGGRVCIGSGNLTYTGWGGNQELATVWSVGPQHEDRGAGSRLCSTQWQTSSGRPASRPRLMPSAPRCPGSGCQLLLIILSMT